MKTLEIAKYGPSKGWRMVHTHAIGRLTTALALVAVATTATAGALDALQAELSQRTLSDNVVNGALRLYDWTEL